MSDLYLKDSKGRYQQVCIQLLEMSCGPACVAMVERIYKHLDRSDEPRTIDISRKYPGGFTIKDGTYGYNLSTVLNAMGVKAYASTYVTPAAVYSYLKHYASFSTPVIAHVEWANTARHFMVCAIYDPDDTFVFFDPWYGIIEVPGSKFPKYEIDSKAGKAVGTLSGWLVITYH
jgi:hypothetical protein